MAKYHKEKFLLMLIKWKFNVEISNYPQINMKAYHWTLLNLLLSQKGELLQRNLVCACHVIARKFQTYFQAL